MKLTHCLIFLLFICTSTVFSQSVLTHVDCENEIIHCSNPYYPDSLWIHSNSLKRGNVFYFMHNSSRNNEKELYLGILDQVNNRLEEDSSCSSSMLTKGYIYLKVHDLKQANILLRQSVLFNANGIFNQYFLGISFLAMDSLQQAEVLFSQLCQMAPKSPLGYFGLGKYFHAMGNFEDARKHYSKAIKTEQRFVEAYYYNGLLEKENGNYSKALQHFMKITEIAPDFAGAYFMLGMVSVLSEDDIHHVNQTALNMWDKAIALDSSNYFYYYCRAMLYAEWGFYKASFADIEKVLSLSKRQRDDQLFTRLGSTKNNLLVLKEQIHVFISRSDSLNHSYVEKMEKCFSLFLIGQNKDVDSILTAILQTDTDNANAYYMKASMAEYGEDYKAASYLYEQCFLKDSTYDDALLKMGINSMASADYKRALHIFKEHKQKYNDSLVYAYIGMCNVSLGERENAIENFSVALQFNSLQYSLLIKRAQLYMEQKNYKLAIRDFSAALEIDAHNATTYYKRAQCYVEEYDMKNALSDIENALAIQHEFIEALYLKGAILQEQRLFNDAIATFSIIINTRRTHIPALERRGIIYYEAGRYNMAIDDLTKAIGENSHEADVYYYRALSYIRIKNNIPACLDLEKAIGLGHRKAASVKKTYCK